MSIAEKIKVLIVDDQVTSRLLLSDALTQLGFKQITAAGDGQQGAQIMAQQPHHLVISDFNMPKMDGKEFVTAVKQNDKLRHIPIVIYSTTITAMDMQSFNRHGVFHFFNKPADFKILCQGLEYIFAEKF